jgi:glucose/arabinose dehydrogenase
MSTKLAVAGPLCGLVLLTCAGNPTSIPLPPEGGGTLHLASVASGFAAPVYLTTPPGDTARLFVVEQAGLIQIVQHGVRLTSPFIDLTDRVASGGERGLLSVAFHPDYAANGFFYVNYTDLNGDTRVERYSVSIADSNLADTATHKLILFVPQPYSNHNGGLVMFGPDGMLYIGMGDGGSGGDPENRAQNPDSLLGKLLRIDVDGGDPYANPPNNPYVGRSGRDEIWAIGLRNPWRFAFDAPSGLLYIADVGQNDWEEVDVEPAGQGGLNYGWRIMEGAHSYIPDPGNTSRLELPAVEYDHGSGCSVIGGFVYRGTRSPMLVGQYFFADLCGGWLRSFTVARGNVTTRTLWAPDVGPGSPLSFGEDANRELYVLSAAGVVYRIAQ